MRPSVLVTEMVSGHFGCNCIWIKIGNFPKILDQKRILGSLGNLSCIVTVVRYKNDRLHFLPLLESVPFVKNKLYVQ